jgi:hypothetical protein
MSIERQQRRGELTEEEKAGQVSDMTRSTEEENLRLWGCVVHDKSDTEVW